MTWHKLLTHTHNNLTEKKMFSKKHPAEWTLPCARQGTYLSTHGRTRLGGHIVPTGLAQWQPVEAQRSALPWPQG